MTDPEQQPQTEHSHQPCFQFQLRTLLVLVALASIAMSWLTVKIQRAHRQRDAVKSLQSRDAHVLYDYMFSLRPNGKGYSYNREAELQQPEILVTLLGKDFFTNVVQLSFVHIHLALQGSTIPAHDDTVPDSCLAHLSHLPGLNVLDLSGTGIQDAGLRHINHLAHLEYLTLNETPISDAGVEQIAAMRQLRCLRLARTKITDEAMNQLGRLDHLETLVLDETKITDAGLDRLKSLGDLELVCVRKTQVTPQGAKRLHKFLPKCHIER